MHASPEKRVGGKPKSTITMKATGKSDENITRQV